MDTVMLNNGVRMPRIGFGTADMDGDSCEKWVSIALGNGYRMIDTAAAYQNEEAVGRAIQKSGIPRNELFISTKLWIQDSGYEKTKRAFQRSTDRLGTDRIDLYLIHQPVGDIHGSWRALEELYEAGKVRAIGVSNFETDRLADLMLFHKIQPTVNQTEVNVFCQQKYEQEWMQEHKIQMSAWGVFTKGKENFMKEPAFKVPAEKYGKTPAQIMLRWILQRGLSVVIQTKNQKHMKENLEIFDFSLTERETDEIRKLDLGRSIFVNYHLPETIIQLGKTTFDI